MRAILTSIRPRHSCNILNLIKLWEIRKMFPSDYVGWVYIYMCQDHKRDWYYCKEFGCYFKDVHDHDLSFEAFKDLRPLNAKVIARFWCDKVETIQCNWHYEAGNCYDPETFYEHDLLEKSCLTYNELNEYLNGKNGKAIHITKLDVFDRPLDIKEFSIKVFPHRKDNLMTRYLTRPPQSWCYIEV